MALNALKCNHLMPLPFKGLRCGGTISKILLSVYELEVHMIDLENYLSLNTYKTRQNENLLKDSCTQVLDC